MIVQRNLSAGLFTGIVIICVLFRAICGQAQSPPTHPSEDRLLVIISDLHWGLGKDDANGWDPREDFRWGTALEAYLDYVSKEGGNKVDLIILGDLLELWQPPETIACMGIGADLGCTPAEITAITQAVIAAHEDDFTRLRRFAERGENRLYIVPGNHDAALLLPEIWALVFQQLGADPNRVMPVASGIWCSADGKVVAEHGHQIGRDVNRYDDWPTITRESGGQRYLVRPWGEYFVQQIFNDEERAYPIIDNLGPESAGIRYRMAERGMIGSVSDMARFVVFNIFQTSLSQKIDVLGETAGNSDETQPPDPNVAQHRIERAKALGHRLFLKTLPAEDPLAALIAAESPEGSALRQELDQLLVTLDSPEIEGLCLQAARISGTDPCGETPEFGMLLERALVSKRAVMRQHLDNRLSGYPKATIFIYGHTHSAEEAWKVDLPDGRVVTVFNSGAFQRLVGEDGYRARSAGWENPSRGLVELAPEDLPPCYTSVVIKWEGRTPHPRLEVWHSPENGGGRPLAPGDQNCQ